MSQASKKHLKSSSGHTLSFCLALVKHRFKNVSEGIYHPALYGNQVHKLKRDKGAANVVSAGSKIFKSLRRRKHDQVIIERTIGLVVGSSIALIRSFSYSIVF